MGNSPANRVDPSGRFWFLAGAAIGAVAGGGLHVATHWDQIQQGKANWVEAAGYVAGWACIGTGMGVVADALGVGYSALALGVAAEPSSVAAINQLSRLPSTGTIGPNAVRFSQNSIAYRFSGTSYSVDDMAADLRAGTLNPMDVPPIRLVERGGRIFTLDNRRLEAFRRAGVDIPYRAATQGEIAEAQSRGRFSTNR